MDLMTIAAISVVGGLGTVAILSHLDRDDDTKGAPAKQQSAPPPTTVPPPQAGAMLGYEHLIGRTGREAADIFFDQYAGGDDGVRWVGGSETTREADGTKYSWSPPLHTDKLYWKAADEAGSGAGAGDGTTSRAEFHAALDRANVPLDKVLRAGDDADRLVGIFFEKPEGQRG